MDYGLNVNNHKITHANYISFTVKPLPIPYFRSTNTNRLEIANFSLDSKIEYEDNGDFTIKQGRGYLIELNIPSNYPYGIKLNNHNLNNSIQNTKTETLTGQINLSMKELCVIEFPTDGVELSNFRQNGDFISFNVRNGSIKKHSFVISREDQYGAKINNQYITKNPIDIKNSLCKIKTLMEFTAPDHRGMIRFFGYDINHRYYTLEMIVTLVTIRSGSMEVYRVYGNQLIYIFYNIWQNSRVKPFKITTISLIT